MNKPNSFVSSFIPLSSLLLASTAWFQDAWLSFHEWWHEASFVEQSVWPAGVGINFLYAMVRLSILEDDPPLLISIWLEYLFMILVLLNTGQIAYRSWRTYQVFHFDEDDILKSPNIRLSDMHSVIADKSITEAARAMWNLVKSSFTEQSPLKSVDTRPVALLSIWNPSDVSLTLFSLFSPVHLVLWYCMTTESVQSTALIAFLLSLQMNYLILAFRQQGRDRLLQYGFVMREYDTKFVNKRVFTEKYEASVSTTPDDEVPLTPIYVSPQSQGKHVTRTIAKRFA